MCREKFISNLYSFSIEELKLKAKEYNCTTDEILEMLLTKLKEEEFEEDLEFYLNRSDEDDGPIFI